MQMMAYHKYKVILSPLSIIDASAARGGGGGGKFDFCGVLADLHSGGVKLAE